MDPDPLATDPNTSANPGTADPNPSANSGTADPNPSANPRTADPYPPMQPGCSWHAKPIRVRWNSKYHSQYNNWVHTQLTHLNSLLCNFAIFAYLCNR